MLLTIIIVSFNTKELTLQAVTSTVGELKQSAKLAHKTEIVIVDNNSQDGTVASLKRFLSSQPVTFKIIENQSNLGFAQANNLGISSSSGKYVLLLNSDTLLQPLSLEKLMAAFEDSPSDEASATLSSHQGELDRLGILSAQLINPDKTLQPQGGNFPTLLSLSCHLLMLDDIPIIGQWLPSTQFTGKNVRLPSSESGIVLQPWVGGTAMLIKRAVIDEVGSLDGNIFMYGEDVEFCMRAANHHWDVGIVPAATIVHFGSASSSSAHAILGEFKGYQYIWSKHKPLWQRPFLNLVLKLGCSLRLFLFGTIIKDTAKAQVYTAVLEQL